MFILLFTVLYLFVFCGLIEESVSSPPQHIVFFSGSLRLAMFSGGHGLNFWCPIRCNTAHIYLVDELSEKSGFVDDYKVSKVRPCMVTYHNREHIYCHI